VVEVLGGNPSIEIPRHGCHDVPGYFYARHGIQKTPGEMTNNLAGGRRKCLQQGRANLPEACLSYHRYYTYIVDVF